MKHVFYLLGVILLGGLGAIILVADILHGGQLHVVSASVGTGLLVLAVALAVPLQVKRAVEILAPVIPLVRK